jgi:hypothetical protein
MAESKTVSNLPIDVSVRWAKDQELLEQSDPLLKGSRVISEQAQTDVLSPGARSSMDELLGRSITHASWALFLPPDGYGYQRRRLFTSQVAPTLGSEELLADKIDKLKTIGDEGEGKDDAKEKVLKMLEELLKLDKDLTFILSRRNQYQKG